MFRKWAVNKTLYTFWYSVSLLMFTIAVFTEFYAYAFGWTIGIYKLYYLLALSLVAFMGVGTLYLLTWKWVGHLFLAYTVTLTTLLWVQLGGAPLDTALLMNADAAIGGEAILSAQVRSFSIGLSAVGGMILLLGALFSWWKTRAAGNLYIAAAALILSLGGRLAKMGFPLFLPMSELIGIVMLYYGVTSINTAIKEKQRQVE
jgi:hypothetical protein